MDKKIETNQKKLNKKEENWVNELMERQEHDLEEEEEILSSIPNRIRHKWLDEEEE